MTKRFDIMDLFFLSMVIGGLSFLLGADIGQHQAPTVATAKEVLSSPQGMYCQETADPTPSRRCWAVQELQLSK